MTALVETLRGALLALRANKLRAALTLLGIVIGVLAVVAMTATIEGLRRQMDADLQMLGAGVFQVQKWPMHTGFGGHGDHRRYDRRKNFTLPDVALLQDRCTECLRVAGEGWTGGQIFSPAGRATRPGVAIAGGTGAFFDNNGYALDQGRFFTDSEALGTADLAVIGADVADALFPDEDPLGQTIRILNRTYRVIGTIERRGSSFGGSEDNLVVLPIGTFLPVFGSRRSLNITIQARDPQHMEYAQDQVVAILRRARGVAPQDENDFEMFSNESTREQFNSIAGSIAFASIGISAISLIIGGIGVMNIMLVSVTERTSEIGLRRALGARRRRILLQFIIEAVTLTAIGGIIGILLGAGLARLITAIVWIPTVIPASAVIASVLTSGAIGLLFGVYPALRASRLDPVEAMRHE